MARRPFCNKRGGQRLVAGCLNQEVIAKTKARKVRRFFHKTPRSRLVATCQGDSQEAKRTKYRKKTGLSYLKIWNIAHGQVCKLLILNGAARGVRTLDLLIHSQAL